MPDLFTTLGKRLEQLLEQVTKEVSPALRDQLCAEIRQVLDERERLRPQDTRSGTGDSGVDV